MIRFSPRLSTFAASLVGCLAPLWIFGILVFERLGDERGASLGERLNAIVFVDFFAAFLVALLVPVRDRNQPWTKWSAFEKGVSLIGGGLVLVIGAWLLHGLGGWIIAFPWMAGVAAGWRDTATLIRRSWARVTWAFASAFLVALVAAIFGVDAEAALRSDPRGTFAWGMFYFGGMALTGMLFIWRRMRANGES